MSHPFGLDLTDSPESSNAILLVTGQSQQDILSQQLISTGGLENQNSELVTVQTPLEDQFLLGQSVETSPLSANNSGADILTAGETTREASQLFSNFLFGDRYTAGNAEILYHKQDLSPEPLVGRDEHQIALYDLNRPGWQSENFYYFRVEQHGEIHIVLKDFTPTPEPLTVTLSSGEYGGYLGVEKDFYGFNDLPIYFDGLSPHRQYRLSIDYPDGYGSPATIVTNVDFAGESIYDRWGAGLLKSDTTGQLVLDGNITNDRVTAREFLGKEKGDDVDVFAFDLYEPTLLSYKLTNYNGDINPDINMEIVDSNGISVVDNFDGKFQLYRPTDWSNDPSKGGEVNWLDPGTYYAKVYAPDDWYSYTNYELVLNAWGDPDYSQFYSQFPSY